MKTMKHIAGIITNPRPAIQNANGSANGGRGSGPLGRAMVAGMAALFVCGAAEAARITIEGKDAQTCVPAPVKGGKAQDWLARSDKPFQIEYGFTVAEPGEYTLTAKE